MGEMTLKTIGKKMFVATLALGILVYIAFILILQVNVSKVIELIATANLSYLILAIIVDVGFITLYAVAWYFLVKAILPEFKLKDSLIAVIMGWLGDMILPAAFVTGEVIRLYYLNKKYKVEYSRGVATVVIHRLLSALAFVLFIVLGAFVLMLERTAVATQVFREMIFIALLAGGFVVLVFTVIFNEKLLDRLLNRTTKELLKLLYKLRLERYKEMFVTGVESFKSSLAIMRDSRMHIIAGFAFLMLQWTCGILIPYMVFRALGNPVGFWLLALAYSIYGAVDNIPLGIPVNAGVLDTAMSTTFILLGINREIAVSATMLTRFITVIFEAALTGTLSILFGIREIIKEVELPKKGAK